VPDEVWERIFCFLPSIGSDLTTCSAVSRRFRNIVRTIKCRQRRARNMSSKYGILRLIGICLIGKCSIFYKKKIRQSRKNLEKIIGPLQNFCVFLSQIGVVLKIWPNLFPNYYFLGKNQLFIQT